MRNVTEARDILRNYIDSNYFAPGSCLPSEYDLANLLKTSITAIKKALNILSTEGLVTQSSTQGLTHYIVNKKKEENLSNHIDFVLSAKQKNSTISIREQNKYLRPAGPFFADFFGIDEEDSILSSRRQALCSSDILYIEDIYIPCPTYPGIYDQDLTRHPIFDIFTHMGLRPSSFKQNMELVGCCDSLKKKLRVDQGIATILFQTSYQSADGNNIFLSKKWIPSDKMSFKVAL